MDRDLNCVIINSLLVFRRVHSFSSPSVGTSNTMFNCRGSRFLFRELGHFDNGASTATPLLQWILVLHLLMYMSGCQLYWKLRKKLMRSNASICILCISFLPSFLPPPKTTLATKTPFKNNVLYFYFLFHSFSSSPLFRFGVLEEEEGWHFLIKSLSTIQILIPKNPRARFRRCEHCIQRVLKKDLQTHLDECW